MPIDLLASPQVQARKDLLSVFEPVEPKPVDLLAQKKPVDLLAAQPKPPTDLLAQPTWKDKIAKNIVEYTAQHKGEVPTFMGMARDALKGAGKQVGEGLEKLITPPEYGDTESTPVKPLAEVGSGIARAAGAPIEAALALPATAVAGPEKGQRIAQDITGIMQVGEPAVEAIRGKPETITGAAVKTPEGVITGKNHDAAYEKAGIERDDSHQEGFATNKRPFITREEAAKLGKQTGQAPEANVEAGKLHSEDVAQAKGQPPSKGIDQPNIASRAITGVKKVFAPDKVSPAAGRVAALKRRALGTATRDTLSSGAELDKHVKNFENLTPEQEANFAKYVESRSKKKAQLTDPQLQAGADAIKASSELRRRKIESIKSLKKTSMVQDYLTRSFKAADGSEPTPAQKQNFANAVGKQGRGGNLKARKYVTWSEAKAAAAESGMVPAEKNFIKAQDSYNRNMDMFIAHNEALDAMRKEKIVKYIKDGGKVPDGWVPLEGRLSEKSMPDSGVKMRAYAPVDAARVYNNFLSKGLTQEDGSLLQSAQKTANFITQLKLGLSSTYHAGMTGAAAISSDLARVTRKGINALKNPTETAAKIPTKVKELLASEEGDKTAPGNAFSPYRVAKEGSKFNKQYLRIADYGPDTEKLVNIATRANSFAAKRQSYMLAAGKKTFKDIFSEARAKNAPLGGAAKALAHGIGKITDKVSGPMFDTWIPNMKRGVVIERLQQWIEDHPNSTPEQQEAYARTLGESIDNRFGEMNRDNLFWPKAMKDAASLALLSYSWVLGGARMVASAAGELGRTALKGEELGPNAEYLLASAVTSAVLNSVYQYIHTGTLPSSPSQAIWPASGGKQNAAGTTKPEQVVLPTGHWNQFAEYMHDPLGELYNEGSIGAKVLYDALRNRDYRNLPIAKPWSQWHGQWAKELPPAVWSYAKWLTGNAVTPISLQTYYNRNKGTGISKAETLLGVRPAPAQVVAPERLNQFQRKADRDLWKKKLKSDNRLEGRHESKGPGADISDAYKKLAE